MMVSTCSNELKFMSERERSTKPALNGYTNPDFRELRPVDPSDGVPLSRTGDIRYAIPFRTISLESDRPRAVPI